MAGLSAAAGAGERLAVMAASIVRVRIIVQAVGAASYGSWLAVVGLAQSGTMLNGGTQYAFVRRFAEASLDHSGAATRRLLSTGFFLYCAIALAGCSIGFGLMAVVPIERLVGDAYGPLEAKRLLTICVIWVFASLPLNLFATLLVGLQRQYLVSTWRSVGAVVPVALMWAAVHFSHSSMEVLALILVACDLVSSLSLAVFVSWRTGHSPTFRDFDPSLIRSLFLEGASFLTADVGNWLKLGLPVLLIAGIAGPTQLAQFAVVLQLCQMCVGFTALTGTSLWPAYSQSAALGDRRWLAEAFTRASVVGVLVSGWAGAMLIALGGLVIRVWLHDRIAWSPPIAVLLAIWMVGQVFVASAAAFLSGVSRSRQMAGIVLAEGLTVSLASAVLVGWLGPAGVAAAMVVAVCGSGFALLHAVRRVVEHLSIAPLLRSLGAAAAVMCLSAGLVTTLRGGSTAGAELSSIGIAILITCSYIGFVWYRVATPPQRHRLIDVARAKARIYWKSQPERFVGIK